MDYRHPCRNVTEPGAYHKRLFIVFCAYALIFRTGGIREKKNDFTGIQIPPVCDERKRKRKGKRIHECSTSHSADRTCSWIYYCCAFPKHSGGISDWGGTCSGRNVILFHGGGAVYDTYGRACGRKYAPHPKTGLYCDSGLYSGFHHYYF